MSSAAGFAALLLLACVPSAGLGQQWAKEMFDHTSHDFGTVARGAKVEHRFTLENVYEEDARILSVRSSCGCTSPQFSKESIKTWEKSDIVAVLDTRDFLGEKDATLTVKFDLPFPAEVQLHVHAYIRSDIVIQPGVVAFGTVPEGAAAQKKVTVSYAGRQDWHIESVESNNPRLQARAVETGRAAGQVTYDLIVDLKEDTPVGYIRDHLVLVTNDFRPQAARVPVAVEGVVAPSVTVRPSPLLMGVVGPAKTVTRRLVVQGAAPFRILGAKCDDARFQCTVPAEEKTLHMVPVTFTASAEAESVDRKILIETDRAPGKPIEVPVQVQVAAEGPTTF